MHLMIDIETMSTRVDALVLSIGAIMFGADKLGNEFFATPSITEQILAGRHIDPATQKWWATQTPAAAQHWVAPDRPQSVADVLDNLALFVVQENPERVWANGAVFDIGIIEHLYNQFSRPIPWRYSQVRDARTAYELLKEGPPAPRAECDIIPHEPISDCKTQVYRLWDRGYPEK